MKIKNIAAVLLLIWTCGFSSVVSAAEIQTVQLTEENQLVYTKDKAELAGAFDGMAPGDSRTVVIKIENQNSHKASFFISQKTTDALEEAGKASGGAYEFQVEIGNDTNRTSLLDADAGGYAENVASAEGLAEITELNEYRYMTALNPGESADVYVTLTLDGEGMDSANGIDYSRAAGAMEFEFRAYYADDRKPVVITNYVTEHGKEDIEEIKKTILNSTDYQKEQENALKEHTRKKEEMSASYKGFFQKQEDVSRKIADLDKEIYRLNSQREKLEEAGNYQTNYMWEEYELTLHAAMELRNEAFSDLTDLKKQIAGIKDDIRKLGDVNVNAIEDFKNLEERYEFLKNQREDLIEAEVTLKQIIEELDTAMRRQFEEEFAKIKEEFNSVFKQLFGGGKGTLELLEDEDILEAGIRIIAQPPGKKKR